MWSGNGETRGEVSRFHEEADTGRLGDNDTGRNTEKMKLLSRKLAVYQSCSYVTSVS